MIAPMPPRPKVTVIVPCRNEERFIARCLDSILATTYPHDRLEVLVIDGRSDDRTGAILNDYVARWPMVRVLDNPGKIQPAALNVGIRAAAGEILVRMDAHALYPTNYIADLVHALEQTGADNVGGVLITTAASETPMGRAIAAALSHPFGVGNAYFRIGVRESRWVDTVAFFCCRRETFDRIGLFDERQRDEDSEFNARLTSSGGRVLLVPNVVAYYYPRETLRQVARMYYQYGYSKPLVVGKLRRVTTFRQLVPPLFLLSLFVSGALAPWASPAAKIFTATAGTYLLSVIAFAFQAGAKAGLGTVAALGVVFPVIHFSYGIGYLWSMLQLVRRSRRPWPASLPSSR